MMHKTKRRVFLRHLIAGAGAGFILPRSAKAFGSFSESFSTITGSVNHPIFEELLATEPETAGFWEMVRKQFSIHQGLIMMNAANLCPAPLPVSDNMIRHLRGLNTDASSQDRQKYHAIKENTHIELGKYLNVDAAEIVVTRNTSEGNNTIINGMDLGKGDELVYWDQNHQSLNIAIEVRAKRHGFTPIRVRTPEQPASGRELVEAFTSAFSRKTRLVCFSHISNITGTAIPAGLVCQAAREKGILSLVDGAQSFGYKKLDLKEMGCDFFTGSAHKWLMGPKEAGVLYVNKEAARKVWPMIISKGWTWEAEGSPRNLEHYGQRNDAIIAAFGEAVKFHQLIGPEHIEKRIRNHFLSLKTNLLEQIPGMHPITPLENTCNGNIIVFTVDGRDADKVVQTLYDQYGIASAAMHYDFTGIRFSPGIYNNLKELEYTVEGLSQLVANN